jgi:hypothetical protein
MAEGTASLAAPREGANVIAPRRDLLGDALGVVGTERHPTGRMKLDLGPVVDVITAYLNAHGIPLHQDPELSGEKGIVFSAAFRVNDALPDMQFHIGDRGPLDAFYGGHGFRLSLSWAVLPEEHIALHFGGGEDSEFGNWAIAGMQWHHPTQPLVIGCGLPIALSNANGPVGFVAQIRYVLP